MKTKLNKHNGIWNKNKASITCSSAEIIYCVADVYVRMQAPEQDLATDVLIIFNIYNMKLHIF